MWKFQARGCWIFLQLLLLCSYNTLFHDVFSVIVLCFRQIQTKAELKVFDLRYLYLSAPLIVLEVLCFWEMYVFFPLLWSRQSTNMMVYQGLYSKATKHFVPTYLDQTKLSLKCLFKGVLEQMLLKFTDNGSLQYPRL